MGKDFRGIDQSGSGSTRRVLVIFPGALGDLICLAPALRATARMNQNDARGCTLELMARGELARFAIGRMGIERGYSIDRGEVADLFSENGPRGAETLAFFEGYAHIYTFFAENDPNFRRALGEVAGGPVYFLPFRPPGTGHITRAYLDAVFAANEGAEYAPADAEVSGSIDVLDEDLAKAARTLARFALAPGKFVMFLPGSGSPKKNWPAENFVELARQIEPESKALVVLGPAETAIEPVFREEFATVTGAELGEVAGLARLAAGFVGNDSGVSHLAAAAGAPGVVLFGPTEPERWRPLGSVEVLRRDPLTSLAVAEVAKQVRQLCQSAAAMTTMKVEG
jgi:heptosyltransferase III